MTKPGNSFRKIAVEAARAGDSKKAEPVAVYDLAGKSPLADYAVLMMVESSPHLEAVEEEVLLKMKRAGIHCLHKDGMRSRTWKVLDYGGTLVHIYDHHASEFYAIDKIYAGCRQVAWEAKSPAPPRKAVKKTIPKKKPAARKTAARKAVAGKAARKTVKKK